MKAVLVALSLLLVAGCGEHYRYPCQDPANWKKKECNRPLCEADGMCWDKLSGVDSKELENKPAEEQSAADVTEPAHDAATHEEHTGE